MPGKYDVYSRKLCALIKLLIQLLLKKVKMDLRKQLAIPAMRHAYCMDHQIQFS